MRIETDRLLIRPFTAQDLDEFRKLLDIPEVEGWRRERSNAKAFLDWHISNYARMDVIHGIVCLGVFETTSGRVLGAAGAGEHCGCTSRVKPPCIATIGAMQCLA